MAMNMQTMEPKPAVSVSSPPGPMRPSQKPKPPRRGVPAALKIAVLVLAVAVAAYLLGRHSGHTAPAAKPPPQAAKPSGPPSVTLTPQQVQYADLQTAAASTVTLPTRLSALGVVAPNLNGIAQVSSRLAGKIVSVPVNVGQNVSAGQVVAVISSPDLATAQAAVHDAVLRRTAAQATFSRVSRLGGLGQYGQPALLTARISFQQVQGEVQTDKDSVNVQQAQVVQAEAQAALAQKTFARAQLLLQAQLISRQDWEQAQANVQQANAALASARTNLQTAVDKQTNAQKRLQIASRELSRQAAIYRGGLLTAEQVGPARAAYQMAAHEVEAALKQLQLLGGDPVDEASALGGLLSIKAPIGGRVSARTVSVGDQVTPDQPILTVLNVRTVIVQLNVYQEDLPHLHVGMPVLVVSNTAPGRNYRGVISALGSALDPNTRTMPVYCAIRNPDGALRPGAYLSGTIYGAARTETLAVPQAAVQTTDAGQAVFVPGPHPGVYVALPVKAGETVDGMTQIKQGLTPGQTVVTKNAFLLKSELGKQGPGG